MDCCVKMARSFSCNNTVPARVTCIPGDRPRVHIGYSFYLSIRGGSRTFYQVQYEQTSLQRSHVRAGAIGGTLGLHDMASSCEKLCASCRAQLSDAGDQLCLFHQGGNIHLTAKHEVPEDVFKVVKIPEIKANRAKFTPYALECLACRTLIGRVCKFGPNNEDVYVFKRDGVMLRSGGKEYLGTYSITPENCPFLDVRDLLTFYGKSKPSEALASPPSMHKTVSRGEVVKPSSASALVVDPFTLTKTEPRDYQVETFIRACLSNSIVVLPTGTGKTLVAAMLIRYWHSQNPDKWVIYLTETCPLAEQQGEYLKYELQDTGHYSSLVGLVHVSHGDNSTPGQRLELINAAPGVLVTTAGAFIAKLEHGFRLDGCSLVIFDEVHHCTKSHMYAAAAHQLKAMRGTASAPHILGLTASPAQGKALLTIASQLRALNDLLDTSYNIPVQYFSSLLAAMNQTDTEVVAISSSPEELQLLAAKADEPTPTAAAAARAVVSGSERYNELVRKVHELVEERRARGTDVRMLVFSRTRSVARALVELLKQDKVAGTLKPALMVGYSGEDGMSWRTEQKPTLEKFRSGEVQLLVATSVVEEGLDVPSCDVVIRYNGVKTTRELIQSRGRVRHRTGQYFVFVEPDEQSALRALQQSERAMALMVEEYVTSREGRALGQSSGVEESEVTAAVKAAMALRGK